MTMVMAVLLIFMLEVNRGMGLLFGFVMYEGNSKINLGLAG